MNLFLRFLALTGGHGYLGLAVQDLMDAKCEQNMKTVVSVCIDGSRAGLGMLWDALGRLD